MFLFKRKKIKTTSTTMITLIVEFNNLDIKKIENPLGKLSTYITDTFSDKDSIITTDLQAHPKGYRLTYKIILPYKQKYYVSKLAKLTWLSNLQSLSRYYYNIEGNNNGYTI